MSESEVYDRQIRLWGLEAQKRMQEAKVLFCGLRALPAEICKNIILAGINVALLDPDVVTAEDLNAQFFLRPEHVGMNRAEACLTNVQEMNPLAKRAEACLANVQEMNPLAKVTAHTQAPSSLPDSFFAGYDVIVASGVCVPPQELLRLDGICRKEGKVFIHADVFGFHGWAFLDLGESFKGRGDDVKSSNVEEPAPVKEFTLSYPSLSDALAVPWSALKGRFPVPRVYVMARLLGLFQATHGHLPKGGEEQDVRVFVSESKAALVANGLEEGFLSENELSDLATHAHDELSPVCAVLGGILGQEILKAISHKGEPSHNIFVWDGDTHEGRVIQVGDKKQ